MIQLGDRVKDSITGFEGVAIGRTEWLHGCVRITIQGDKLHNGVPVEPVSFDEPQVVIVKAKKVEKKEEETPPGGPRPEPSRMKDPI